jgi:hypothetical protein
MVFKLGDLVSTQRWDNVNARPYLVLGIVVDIEDNGYYTLKILIDTDQLYEENPPLYIVVAKISLTKERVH